MRQRVSRQFVLPAPTVRLELIALSPVRSELINLTQVNSRLPTASSAQVESSAIQEALLHRVYRARLVGIVQQVLYQLKHNLVSLATTVHPTRQIKQFAPKAHIKKTSYRPVAISLTLDSTVPTKE